MIQRLRKVHRGTFSALLLILPALFVAGLWSRHEPLRGPSHIEGASNTAISDQTAVIGGTKIHIRIVSNRDRRSEWQLKLSPESSLLAPDVLVYWSKTNAISELPVDAKLLGSYEPAKQYSLPEQEMKESGQGFVILYSLGWKKTIGSVAIGPVGGQQ